MLDCRLKPFIGEGGIPNGETSGIFVIFVFGVAGDIFGDWSAVSFGDFGGRDVGGGINELSRFFGFVGVVGVVVGSAVVSVVVAIVVVVVVGVVAVSIPIVSLHHLFCSLFITCICC